jgi:CHAP domain
MSVLSLTALAAAQAALNAGVCGGKPTRFCGPEVNGYLASVGLSPGYPWCSAFVYSCFKNASDWLQAENTCPRTASAVRLFHEAEKYVVQFPPAPGDVFVLIHRDGIHGHCGIVESVSPSGQEITSVEGDTNAEGSSTGDACGRHTWTPADGSRGRLLGYLAL